jgi:ABC-type microcin C transport system duplicated ATPase subunit YejF
MRTLDLKDGPIASVLIADELATRQSGTLDVSVRMKDGRRFVLTLFTLEHLRRQLDSALSFVTPGMLVVKQFSDEAILDAVRSAMRLDIERLGVLQPPINQ